MAYKKNKPETTSIKVNKGYKGETIEMKVRRIMQNNEPITDGAPIVFTERKDGVRPETNIRTDRWDVAIEMTDMMSKDKLAKREARLNPDTGTGRESGGTASNETTSQGSETTT